MTPKAARFIDEVRRSKQGAVVVLSGGLDSTTALRLTVEALGQTAVHAITFTYGQRQIRETELAALSCQRLGVKHTVIDISFLGQIAQGFSANVDSTIEMPTIDDVLGEASPVTYVPNRNMIMMSIAASYAEVHQLGLIVAGFQSNDSYGYHDTTPEFVSDLNAVLNHNRTIGIQIVCPFNELTKREEIEAVLALDGNLDLFATTLTCYNPDSEGRSCGTCPSCSERLKAFSTLGLNDPINYQD